MAKACWESDSAPGQMILERDKITMIRNQGILGDSGRTQIGVAEMETAGETAIFGGWIHHRRRGV